MRDGLPDMKIECLFEDSAGTLWIGTRAKGVVTYRGDDFAWHSTRDGLSGNGVFGVVEAPDGSVWLATDGGLSKSVAGGFEPVRDAEALSFLWGIERDRDGHLWFGADREPGRSPRVCRWDGAALKTLDLPADEEAPQGRSIHSIVSDGTGNIWCGGHGLYVVARSGVRQVLPDRVELSDIQAMCCTHRGTLVIAAVGATYELIGDEVFDIPVLQGHVEGLSLSPDGSVWAAMRDGRLLRWNSSGVSQIASLNVPLWRAVAFDHTGRVWIGSYGFGLYCYDDNSVRIADDNSGLPDSRVQAIATQGEHVWIGTPTGLLSQEQERMDGWTAKHPDYANDNVTALLADSQGRLWIGKRNGLVYVLSDSVLMECAPVESMIGHRVDCMVEDAAQAVWVASSYGRDVGRYETPSLCEAFGVGSSGERKGSVAAMAVGLDGLVYFGSPSPRMLDAVTVFDGTSFASMEGVGGIPVTALCFDSEHRLWVGTAEGVSVCEGEYVLTYGSEDGLPSELITALFCDSNGRMWIGTEGGGACVYDGRVFQSMSLGDRPFCNTVNDIAEDGDGTIWLGTNGGLVCWQGRRSKVVASIDEVVADTAYASPAQVQFPDTVGRVTVSFRGASETCRAEHLVFRYRLNGYESDWRQTSQREVAYPRLGPGEYEFVVQAADRGLNYSQTETAKLTVIADPRIDALNQALRAEGAQGEFVGESRAMKEVLQQVQEVAWTDLTVLVLGETGTGKGLAARQIHELSERSGGPFIHVNCGSLQEGLVDSELFGHERGAFTGAVSRRLGKFELAQGGTIFLDEIGDLPLESQTRLLKVLQDRTIERVGGTLTIAVDVRVIAATNRDLGEEVRQQRYRADLYYRLNVFPIRIPPLRERREDTTALAIHFIEAFAAHLNQSAPRLAEGAAASLLSYDWPGNVRELEHTLQRAVILSQDGTIGADQLGVANVPEVAVAQDEGPILPLEEYERRYFRKVLQHTGGVIHGSGGAAKLLGMKPTTLRSRLEKLGMRNRKTRDA